jgi:hypothetical protein
VVEEAAAVEDLYYPLEIYYQALADEELVLLGRSEQNH